MSLPKMSPELRVFLQGIVDYNLGESVAYLHVCKVSDLKEILSALYSMPFFVNSLLHLKRSLNQRKDKLTASILQILYQDYPSCQVIRPEAASDLVNYRPQPKTTATSLPLSSQMNAIHHSNQQAFMWNVTYAQQLQNQAVLANQNQTANSNQAKLANQSQANVAIQNQANVATQNQAANQNQANVANQNQANGATQHQAANQNQANVATQNGHPVPPAFSPPPTTKRTPSKKRSPARKSSPKHPSANQNGTPIHPAFLPKPSIKRSTTPDVSTKAKKVKVKSEPQNDNDDESMSSSPTPLAAAALNDATPQNPRENTLTTELLAMGFSDRTEILWSVRKLAQSNGLNQLSSEDVMVDIISTREETDEARKMDEARKLSEQARKQESKRLRLAIAQRQTEERKKASWSEWLSRKDMYASSWILVNANVKEKLQCHVKNNLQVKETIMEVLDLEKKARKWYGQTLPRSYFRGTLTQRLSSELDRDCSDKQVLKVLNREITVLKEAMFTLSVQQGGVPKLFIDAHDCPATTIGDDDDEADEEVMVVRVDGGFGLEKGMSTPKSLCKQDVHRTPDVIEIE